ncbi:MAG: hypothetical protein AAGA60_13620 [Cyanobacteria bacterium P01_E01_bin.42]
MAESSSIFLNLPQLGDYVPCEPSIAASEFFFLFGEGQGIRRRIRVKKRYAGGDRSWLFICILLLVIGY